MNISLVDVDKTGFPNLALMKIAAWHKSQGDEVKWYDPLFDRPDRIYKSKIFTFTPDTPDYCEAEIMRGGTGYRLYDVVLPQEVDDAQPDYSMYPLVDYAVGFLSRGCIRRCPWCVVPKKEGALRQYRDCEQVAQGRKRVRFLDNNFLANDRDFVREQLEKMKALDLRIDFNQALDARLVDEENARWLAAVKWDTYMRFSADTMSTVEPVKKAVRTMQGAGYKGVFMVFLLAKEVGDTLERIYDFMAFDKKIIPYVMPYRNLEGDGKIVNPELMIPLRRWCNSQALRTACRYEDYRPYGAERKAKTKERKHKDDLHTGEFFA